MTISPAGSATTAAANPDAGGTGAMAKLSSNFDTFLTLLTTQLKNQDPTSPMDSNQFTQQLVEFSQVEQQIDTNSNLKALLAQGQSNGAAVAAGYLGKKVSVTNGMASLADGAAAWTYTLDAASSATQLTVSDANGRIVYAAPGETGAGNHSFAWDGKDANGNALQDGAYRLAVTAMGANGQSVTSHVASAGAVSQIDMTGGTPKLVVGNMEIGLADIAAIAN
jgi:flagellar basal-body rod modification protein FlgD